MIWAFIRALFYFSVLIEEKKISIKWAFRKASEHWPNSGNRISCWLLKGPMILTSPRGSIWVITLPVDWMLLCRSKNLMGLQNLAVYILLIWESRWIPSIYLIYKRELVLTSYIQRKKISVKSKKFPNTQHTSLSN